MTIDDSFNVLTDRCWAIKHNSLGDEGLEITIPFEGVTISIFDAIYTFESREDLRDFVMILEKAANMIYADVFDDPADRTTFTI